MQLMEELGGLRQFLAEADKLFRDKADLLARARHKEAPTFNVFLLTGWVDIEVRTHQKLISYLLDPTKGHGQGNFLLEPFLHLISEKLNIILPAADSIWKVSQGTRNIDILLDHQDNGQSHSVIVEVKWNAREHRVGQLYSYWEMERRRTRQARVPAVFLTRRGKQPSYPAAPGASLEAFRQDALNISFGKDIVLLLERALELQNALPSRLRETIMQYVEILRD
jgi:hypothetical protein